MITLIAVFMANIGCFKRQYRIRLGYSPFSASLTMLVAQKKGYFEKYGLKMDLVKFDTINEMRNA